MYGTMFNFNALPGERWEMQYDSSGFFTNVIDTGTTLIQGESIKWLYVEYTPSFSVFVYDTIYERIGAKYNFPYTSSVMSTDGEYGGTCSFSDTTINQFPNPDINCEYMPDAVYEISKDKEIIVFPNPSNGILHLKYTYEKPIAFEVLDIFGRPCSYTHINYNNTISLEELNSGIYFMKFYWEDHSTVKRIEIIK